MTLVIMAAGMGSRFGGLKQVEPFGPNGEFIIDYSIYDAKQVGVDKVVFIIKEENYDLFRNTVGKRIEDKIKVEYVFQKNDFLPEGIVFPERTKPLGTSHAIYCCKDVVKDNFIVINADDYYGKESFKIIKDYMDNIDVNDTKFSLAGYITKNTLTENGKVKRGIIKTNENNELTSIIESSIGYVDGKLEANDLETNEKVDLSADDLVSMNFFGFTPKIFDYIEKNFYDFYESHKDKLDTCEFLLPTTLTDMINENKCEVEVLKTPSVWHGVTYKEDKEEVQNAINSLIENKEYPNNLWD